MTLDIGTVVNVSSKIATAGVESKTFGRGLIVTNDALIAASGPNKLLTFTTYAEAEDRLPAGSDALAAAKVWFAASPPPQALYVGRWAQAAVNTSLRGGTPASTVTTGPLDAANATFVLDGQTGSLSLAAADTYAAVASAVQTEIRTLTGHAATTFTYDTTNKIFVLTRADGNAIADGYMSNTTSTTDTDIAAALGMAANSNGRLYLPGSAAETLASAMGSFVGSSINNGEPAGVMLAADVPANDSDGTTDTRLALSAWAETSDVVAAVRERSESALTANETTSIAAQINALNRGRTAVVYCTDANPVDVALLASLSSQALDLPATMITPVPKALPSVTAIDVTKAQLEELQRKRTSVYANVAGTPAFLGGYTSRSGNWADAVWWLAWLTRRVETAVFSRLRSARRAGRALIADALLNVMQEGVRNGGIEGGRSVSAATRADIIAATGNADFNGRLESGYLVWVDPSPTEADVTNRVARFKIWITGSAAVHSTFGDITFNN